MKIVVPPGGFAGFSQMTQASQRALGSAVGRSNGTKTRRRRKSAKTKTARAKTRTRRSNKRRGKLVKGSAAAKRFMANLRKRRKK